MTLNPDALKAAVGALRDIAKSPLTQDEMIATALGALKRLAALPKQEPSGWMEISSAPKDGRDILLGWFLEYGGGGPPAVAFWHSTKKLWCNSRVFLNAEGYFSATHWQPLPDPPKGDDHDA